MTHSLALRVATTILLLLALMAPGAKTMMAVEPAANTPAPATTILPFTGGTCSAEQQPSGLALQVPGQVSVELTTCLVWCCAPAQNILCGHMTCAACSNLGGTGFTSLTSCINICG